MTTKKLPSLSEFDSTAIKAIVDRAYAAVSPRLTQDLDKTLVVLFVMLAHKAKPLDLEAMLAGRDLDLTHDVFGIYRRFNPETKTFDDFFRPRFTKRTAVAHAS